MDPQAAKEFILAKLNAELPVERSYHSLEHTLDVYASVIDIAASEGVQGEDLVLLKMAALYHDSGFTEQHSDHEEVGCRIVRENLPHFGFTPVQVLTICNMIMSTRIPQAPKDHLGRILCDADLDYLGRNDFDRIGDTLYAEFLAYGNVHTRRQWNELQVKFLEKHDYFTQTNIRLREPLKQQHLARLRAWLAAHQEE